MKANLKGLSGIKGLFLLHGEKLLILLVGACAALFVYKSMQVDHLDANFQHKNLNDSINLTKSAVTDFDWGKAVEEHPDQVRKVKPITEEKKLEVPADPYADKNRSLNPPVIEQLESRTDPELLAAVDVRAYGQSGLIPIIDDQVMRERELARQAEDAKREQERKKEEERAAEMQNAEGERGARGRGIGGRGRDGEGAATAFDPDHPNRRPIENWSRPTGGMTLQGDERVEEAYWAMVVAKVPIREQLKKYRDVMEKARGGYNPEFDFPRYAGFLVQRVEVLPGKQVDWTKAQAIGVYDGDGHKMGDLVMRQVMDKLYAETAKLWPVEVAEVVDERYLDFEQLLNFPLPPIVGRQWGADATHPDIPLIVNAPPPEEEVDPTLEQPQQAPAGGNDLFSRPDPTQAMGPRGGAPRGFGRGGGGEFGGRSRGGFAGEGGRMGGRGGMGRGRGFGGEEGGRGGYGGTRAAGMLPREVSDWLLRFIDFTVQPGKKYKYRVQLIVWDPNQGSHIPPTALASSVIQRQRESAKARADKKPAPVIYTAWSEPSPTVGIPLAGSVRVAKAKLPGGKLFNDEPSVSLLVESFGVDEKGNAIQAAKEKELRRGFVANFVEETEYVDPGGQFIDKIDSFKFHTGMMVTDISGGGGLSRDFTAPTRVMLMGPAGELYIRNELDDTPALETHRLIFTKDRRRNRGEEEGGRGFPGGGGIEGGGRRGRG